MKNIFEIAIKNPLFKAIEIQDFEKMMLCMDAKTVEYKKGEPIIRQGDCITAIGIVLNGSVKVVKEDADGNMNIMAEISKPELFGEVFACAGVAHSPVSVVPLESCQILFINYHKIITTCSSACCFHARLIENMLTIIAQKNLLLNRKIEILSKRTIRERLMMFFDMQRNNTKKFILPYNREELAAFICVDRSAMSNELSKMQTEGIIRFRKNEFELL